MPNPKIKLVTRTFEFRNGNGGPSPSGVGLAGDGRTFEGYAAVFDSPTEIDSYEGKFTESVARGSFAKTLRESTPVVQFQHGQDPATGQIPIAEVLDIREDNRGLFMRARLFDNERVRPVRDAIAAGALKGMSFRFQITRDRWNQQRTQRTIQEVKLFEAGPVVYPAYAEAKITGLRKGIGPQKRERILRELQLLDIGIRR